MAVIEAPAEPIVEVIVEVDESLGVLERTIEWLESHMWMRRRYHGYVHGREAACLVGAMRQVAGDKPWTPAQMKAYERLRRAVLETGIHVPSGGVESWNDVRCKSKAEAIAMLRRAMHVKL